MIDQTRQVGGVEERDYLPCDIGSVDIDGFNIRDIDRCYPVDGPSRGGLHLVVIGTPDHHKMICLHELSEAVALDQNAR